MKYALRISYLGKNYCGWQRQSKEAGKAPPLPSIQEVVENALLEMTKGKVTAIASGRTDAGVHALGQIVHFKMPTDRFTPEIFKRGLNTLLPPDIRVLQVAQVDDDFHAQRSATHKQYSYVFLQGPAPLPQWMDTSWWIYRKLDVEAMQTALNALRGEHDFKVFQGRKSAPMKSTVRTILEAEVTRERIPEIPGCDLNEIGFSLVRMRLVGTGFLKQMVRGIAGTLVQIGENRRKASEMAEILRSQERSLVGPTAPAKGLTLERVWYTTDPHGNSN